MGMYYDFLVDAGISGRFVAWPLDQPRMRPAQPALLSLQTSWFPHHGNTKNTSASRCKMSQTWTFKVVQKACWPPVSPGPPWPAERTLQLHNACTTGDSTNAQPLQVTCSGAQQQTGCPGFTIAAPDVPQKNQRCSCGSLHASSIHATSPTMPAASRR